MSNAFPTAVVPAPASSGHAFRIVLSRTGQTLEVGNNESIAEVLQLAGVGVETVCEQGICGTCVTPWLAGEPEHHDSCLSDEERQSHLAICCARSRSDSLTLDL